MKLLPRMGLFFCFCLFAGAGFARTEETSIRVVADMAGSFNPSSGETTALRYEIDQDAQVTALVYDALCRPIRTLPLGEQGPGLHEVTWDGRSESGQIVPDEAYTWGLIAQSDSGDSTINFLGTGGQPVQPQERSLDTETGLINYRLEQPARVRLRLGLRGAALMRVLLDWIPQATGMQAISWDGMDEDGIINLLPHPDLAYDLTAFALPDYAIITIGNPVQDGERPYLDLTGDYEPCPPLVSQTLHPRAQEARDLYRAPHFEISLPETSGQTENGLPIVEGIVPVRIVVDEADIRLVTEARFEVILYVDNVYVYEDEDSFTPYTYQWNTLGLNQGVHVLTVNVHVYGDQISTRLIQVYVNA